MLSFSTDDVNDVLQFVRMFTLGEWKLLDILELLASYK